jgi:DNA-binding transcriptional LysR family regulator
LIDKMLDDRDLINLRHLRAWLTVVEEGSVTAAAHRLGVSQPALSQQLRALENSLGSDLLERLHSGMQPTPFGRSLLADAKATISSAKRLAHQARSVAGFEAGVLEIATLPSLVDATLLEPIRRWHLEHSEVAIRLHEFSLQTLMEKEVTGGLCDLAVGVRPSRWSGPVVSLGWEQFVVVLPPGDPLFGGEGPIALTELADRTWVLYEESNGLADFVTVACAHAGFRPREGVSTSQVQAAVQLASAGIGPVLIPSDNVPTEIAGAARPLDPPIVWELAAFTRKVMSPSAAIFVEILKEREFLAPSADALVLPAR